MLVFQVLLFGGYAYAHLTISRLPPRAQAVLHIVLLLAACLALPIVPNLGWKPTGDEEPISRIVLLLGATVGTSLFCPFGDGPAASRLVQPDRTRAARPIGCTPSRTSARCWRSFPFRPSSIGALATRVLAYLWSCEFCACLPSVCAAVCAVNAARRARLGRKRTRSTGDPHGSEPVQSTHPLAGTKLLVVRAGDGAVGAAVGDDEPGLPRRGERPLSVGAAFDVVPAVVHSLLRQRLVVLAADDDAGGRAGARSPCIPSSAPGATASFAVQLAGLLHRLFLVRDGLSWRARAAKAGRHASDLVLPGDRGGRSGRRNLRRHHRPAGVQQLLRVAPGAFRLPRSDAGRASAPTNRAGSIAGFPVRSGSFCSWL